MVKRQAYRTVLHNVHHTNCRVITSSAFQDRFEHSGQHGSTKHHGNVQQSTVRVTAESYSQMTGYRGFSGVRLGGFVGCVCLVSFKIITYMKNNCFLMMTLKLCVVVSIN